MSTTVDTGAVRTLEHVSHLRTVTDHLNELLLEAYKKVVAVEELVAVERLVDYGEPDNVHRLARDESLSAPVRQRFAEFAKSLGDVEYVPLLTAAEAAGQLVDALADHEEMLEGSLTGDMPVDLLEYLERQVDRLKEEREALKRQIAELKTSEGEGDDG